MNTRLTWPVTVDDDSFELQLGPGGTTSIFAASAYASALERWWPEERLLAYVFQADRERFCFPVAIGGDVLERLEALAAMVEQDPCALDHLDPPVEAEVTTALTDVVRGVIRRHLLDPRAFPAEVRPFLLSTPGMLLPIGPECGTATHRNRTMP